MSGVDVGETVTVELTVAEVIEACGNKARAKIGEVDDQAWDVVFKLQTKNGALDKGIVKLTRTR